MLRRFMSSVFVMLALSVPGAAFAQFSGGLEGGLAKTVSFFDSIGNIIGTASVSITTIAIMVLGYRFIFGKASWTDTFPLIIGCLVLGSAASFAGFFLG